MTPRVNSYTFSRVNRHLGTIIQPGDLILLNVLDLRSTTQEYVWIEVHEDLGNGTYRALTLQAAELFPTLPAGDTVYFRAEHALQVQTPGGVTLVTGGRLSA